MILLHSDDLHRFAEALGYPFDDLDLLALAVTHRSWCAENAGHESNERLEFLGDAVLGLVVTTHIYDSYRDMPEGELAKVRASVVSAAALAEVGAEIGLGAVLRLGKGEDASGGRAKPSILADAVEAVIGATYLDQGWEAARELVLRLVGERIESAAEGPGGHDFKTQLQELAAREFEELPSYDVRDEGPDHAKRFFAVVSVAGRPVGHGEGRSKKVAEQAAARAAWQQLTKEVDGVSRAERLAPTHPVNGPSPSAPAGDAEPFDLPRPDRAEPRPAVAGRARESESHDA
ncbi:MAG: ribonuclease III [Acidimicrobiales bacterium]